MSDIIRLQPGTSPPVTTLEVVCEPDAHGRCIVCSDDAQPAIIKQLFRDGWTAVAEMAGRETEIDISLIDAVAVGQTVMVHGGVALERISGKRNDPNRRF